MSTDTTTTPKSESLSPFQVSSIDKEFCDYKNTELLRRFLTPNGKIQGRKRSSLIARRQRMIAQSIKRARYMGLLPYTSATL